jgi:putative Holliday junction resolvase
MRMLGVDYGSARVGLALGDTESRIATPWSVVPNEGTLAVLGRIHEIVERDRVEAIVIGVPHPLSDAKGENAQVREIRTFIEAVRGLNLPIHEEDETMTSRLAARQVQESGEKGKRDDLAAAAILQSWLDRNALPS